MSDRTGFRGIATVNIYAADLQAARRWYTELLGTPAYFERDGYVEFRIGDFQQELGIVDARYGPPQHEGSGAVLYWQVDDLDASLERLTALGARAWQPRTERGGGFVTAAVLDPFGNILGVMSNPHYLEVLAGSGGQRS